MRSALTSARSTGLMLWVGVLVTVVFGYFAVRDVRLSETWDALRTSTYAWLLPALAALAFAIFLRALRWRALFAPETRPPLRAVCRALLIGYLFNSILPLRAGEATRIIALKQAAGTSRAETTATVLTERIYDVVTLVVLLFVALFWLPDVSWLAAGIVFGTIVGIAVAVAVILLARRRDTLISLADRLIRRLPFLPHDLGGRAVRNLAHGLAGLTQVRTAGVALGWTLASWGVMSVSFWAVTLCFGLELPLMAGLLVVIATSLSLILPSSPGAIGVFEAAAIIALDAYDVPRAEALSYGVVLHALNFFPFIVAGVLVLAPRGRRLRRERVAV